MPRRFQKGHHAAEEAGCLEWGTVDEKGAVSLSASWISSVPWLKGGTNAREVVFWLDGEGRARAFNSELHSAKIGELIRHETPEISGDASLVFFKGNYQANNCLCVPDPVVAHVLSGSLTGSLWFWSHRGTVELWDEERRRERMRDAVQHIATRFAPH
jgi:hypothetical protein